MRTKKQLFWSAVLNVALSKVKLLLAVSIPTATVAVGASVVEDRSKNPRIKNTADTVRVGATEIYRSTVISATVAAGTAIAASTALDVANRKKNKQ